MQVLMLPEKFFCQIFFVNDPVRVVILLKWSAI